MQAYGQIVSFCLLFIFFIPVAHCQAACNATGENVPCTEGFASNETANCTLGSSEGKCSSASLTNNVSSQGMDNVNTTSVPINIGLYDYFRLRRFAESVIKNEDGSIFLYMSNGTTFRYKTVNILDLYEAAKEETIRNTNASKNDTEDKVCLGEVCINIGSEKDTRFYRGIGTMQLSDQLIVSFAVSVTLYIVLGVIGITGNVLVLVGVLTSKQMNNSTGVLVSCLAISDIITLSFCLPTGILQRYFLNSFSFGQTLCKLVFYFKYFSIFLSTCSMATIAFDRYIAICVPLKAKIFCTVSRARITAANVFLLSVAVCIPTAVVTDFFERRSDTIFLVKCVLNWPSISARRGFFFCYLSLVFVLPVCIMLPAYLKISYVLWKSTITAEKLQAPQSSGNDAKSASLQSRIQVVKMLMTNLFLFVLCWGPISALELLHGEFALKELTDVTFYLTSLGLANSFINPVVYFTMSRAFRNIMISAARRICCCGPQLARATSVNGRSTKMSQLSSSSGSSKASKKDKLPQSDTNGPKPIEVAVVGDSIPSG